MDMLDTITPRSDQLNAEDLLTGPQTITITEVKRGSDDQPVDMVTAEFGPGRVYRPSKTMRRVIVAAWGKESSAYIGRRMTIYRDPEVTFGKDKVGGIKISHLSHIDKRLQIALTVTRGRRAQFTADPLPDEPKSSKPASTQPGSGIGALFIKGGVPDDRPDDRMTVTRKIIKRDATGPGDLTPDEIATLTAQLTAWDKAGTLVDQVADILDMAAIDEAAK